MAHHVVVAGDDLSGLAARYGMTLEQLFQQPANAPLRAIRSAPEFICAGDVLWLPPEENKNPSGPVRRIRLNFDLDPAASNRLNPRLFHANSLLFSYKVRTGDSLGNLATKCGCTWQELARLNWGTEDKDEIGWYLATYFVCKTKNGANLIFTDKDEPGILLLPRPIDKTTGQRVHVLRATRFPVKK